MTMMLKKILFCALLSMPFYAQADTYTVQSTGSIDVAFSPRGGATDLVVKTIEQAQKSILVQAYSFTSAPIAKALVTAKNRGIDVRVILDKSQKTERYSSATYLTNNGVPTWIDRQHAIAHNKVMVVDGTTVITGSFNFSKAAEFENAENVLVLHNDQKLASIYTQNWIEHVRHSEQEK